MQQYCVPYSKLVRAGCKIVFSNGKSCGVLSPAGDRRARPVTGKSRSFGACCLPWSQELFWEPASSRGMCPCKKSPLPYAVKRPRKDNL